MKLWNFIKEEMLRHPQQKIQEDGAELTYEEMVIYAEKLSQQLSGVKCCAVLCQAEMAQATAVLACFAAGVTVVPLSHRYGQVHCSKILDTISPDAIMLESDGQFHVLHIKDNTFKEPSEKPALIMCTSGTSGSPKGAMLSGKNIITNVLDIARYFPIDTDDVILIARPLYHSAVLTGEFLTALIKGTGIRFYSGIFNPGVMLEMINQYKITAFCGTPTLLSMMARLKRKESTLKYICVSGECMGEETGKKIADSFSESKIFHIYGLTEASPRVSYLPSELFNEYPDCVGIPLKSVNIKIIKEDGNVAKENEEGILWVKGDNVMLGYYNQPDKTQSVLSDGWLCTGDMASINDKGLLKIKGRADNLIIKAGMNIYPQEIENALKADDRVFDVLVFAEKDKNTGETITMNIAGDFDNVDQIKTLCKDVLPSYAMPSKINLLSQLKRNGSGKLIREVS